MVYGSLHWYPLLRSLAKVLLVIVSLVLLVCFVCPIISGSLYHIKPASSGPGNIITLALAAEGKQTTRNILDRMSVSGMEGNPVLQKTDSTDNRKQVDILVDVQQEWPKWNQTSHLGKSNPGIPTEKRQKIAADLPQEGQRKNRTLKFEEINRLTSYTPTTSEALGHEPLPPEDDVAEVNYTEVSPLVGTTYIENDTRMSPSTQTLQLYNFLNTNVVAQATAASSSVRNDSDVKITTQPDISTSNVSLQNDIDVVKITTRQPDISMSNFSLHNDIGIVKEMIQQAQHFQEDEYLVRNASYFVLRPKVINSFTPEVLIQAETCFKDGPFLLVAVPSADDHVHERQAIRDTWASPAYGAEWPGKGHLRQTVKVVFFLGVGENTNTSVLQRESAKYKDIVRSDFADTYRNLTLKMVTVLHWSVTHCRSSLHVLKVDEDTFVNLPLLLDLLTMMSANRSCPESLADTTTNTSVIRERLTDTRISKSRCGKYVMGARHHTDHPDVVRKGKWGVDTEAYPLSVYPRYLIGPSYVISGETVDVLYTGYHHVPLVPAEDAYITGILTKTMGVQRIYSPHFGSIIDCNRCDLVKNKFVSQTNIQPFSALYDVWTKFKTGVC